MKHLYSALLCIVVHTKQFIIMWGVYPQPPPVCSIHLDDATAATGQRHQCAHHTPATGGEERESHRANGQGIFWQTVCQLRLAIGKANCGTPHLPTRDG